MRRIDDDGPGGATREQVDRARLAMMADPLTGVGDRKFGERRLRALFSELERYGWSFAIALAAIDRFEGIGDERGRAAADAVLAAVAKIVHVRTRASDEVVRWGDHQFLVIVRNVQEGALAHVFEKVRREVSQAILSTPVGSITVTLSVGATAARAGDNPETLVARAEALMSVSQRAGGNRVRTDVGPRLPNK